MNTTSTTTIRAEGLGLIPDSLRREKTFRNVMIQYQQLPLVKALDYLYSHALGHGESKTTLGKLNKLITEVKRIKQIQGEN